MCTEKLKFGFMFYNYIEFNNLLTLKASWVLHVA